MDTDTKAIARALIALTALAIVVGNSTDSPWVGLIAPAALVLALAGLVRLGERSARAYWAFSTSAVLLLGFGMWLSRATGPWAFTLVWGSICLLDFTVAAVNEFSGRYRHALGFSVVSAVVGIAWPATVAAASANPPTIGILLARVGVTSAAFAFLLLAAWRWAVGRSLSVGPLGDASPQPYSDAPSASTASLTVPPTTSGTSAPVEESTPEVLPVTGNLFGSDKPPEVPDLSGFEDQRPPAAEPAVSGSQVDASPEAPDIVGVAESEGPVISAVPLPGGETAVLAPGGGVSRWKDGRRTGSGTVPVRTPLGIVSTAGGRLVLVDGAGRMVEIEFTTDGVEDTHAAVTGPVRCYAVEPSGATVAYAGEAPGVFGFVVAEDRLSYLVPGLEHVKALAYSADGARLACGTADGAVTMVDLRTGERTVIAAAGEPAAAASLLAWSPRGWVAATTASGLVLWTSDNRTVSAAASQPATALAVERASGDVAIGGADGRVRVYSADLAATSYEVQAAESAIVSLAFRPDGALLAAGANGRVVDIRR